MSVYSQAYDHYLFQSLRFPSPVFLSLTMPILSKLLVKMYGNGIRYNSTGTKSAIKEYMKNKILLLFSFLFFTIVSFSQNRYGDNESTEYTTLNEAGQMADEIVKASGFHANFTIAEE